MSEHINETPLLEVKHLRKLFPVKQTFRSGEKTFIKAVDDVSFTLNPKETLGVVGESGCGKSTMGRSVLRLIEPTDGEIIYKGQDFKKASGQELRKMRAEMQIIFQDPSASLDPRMTVGEIIGEALDIHNLCPNKKDRTDRIKELLGRVGLNTEHANRYPHEFSGGQRQRIGIARALAVQPQLIIADEPVSALDVSIQSQGLNLMNQLKRDMNLTYIFVAHDLSVVEHISDRVGVMYLGNFVEEGDKYSLYQNPLHPYTQALLSAVPIPDPKAKKDRIILEGNIPSALNPPSGCKFHTRCPKCMERCKTEAPQKYQVGDDHFVYCHLYDTEEAKKNAKAAENAVIHQ